MTGAGGRGRARRAAFAIGVALPVTFAGCGGHGTFTQEAKDRAEEAGARMRGATQYDLAWQQFRAGELEGALGQVDASLANSPEVAEGHVLRGRILIELGRFPEAREALEKARELEPANADAHYFHALACERLEDDVAALQSYRNAMAVRDEAGRSRLAAAELLVQSGRDAEAIALLDDGTAVTRNHAGFRQLLGHIAARQGRREDAVRYFLEAVVIDPEDDVLREDLAIAQIGAGQYRSAAATLARLREAPANRDRTDLELVHARCLLEVGRSSEARTLLVGLVDSEDELVRQEAWATLVDVALAIGDAQLLYRSGTELVTQAPTRVEGYLALALWHQGRGDVASALRNVEDALQHCGEDPAARELERRLRTTTSEGT